MTIPPASQRTGSSHTAGSRPAPPPPAERPDPDIAELERKRIGREFHDGIGQKLTSVSVAASILVEKLDDKKLPEAEDARRLLRIIRETVRSARNLARGLNPAALLNKGLENAVEELLTQVRENTKIQTELELRDWAPIGDENAALHVFRIVQEAVNNAVKHSKCGRIHVTLMVEDGRAQVEITDDGCGLPDNADELGGMGLALMSQRAALLGGQLDVQIPTGGGTTIRCAFEPQNTVE